MNILYINTYDPYNEQHGGAAVTRSELQLISKLGFVTTLFAKPLKKRVYEINIFRFIYDVICGRSFKEASYNMLHRNKSFYEKFDLIFCNHDFSAYDYKIFLDLNKPFIVRKHNVEHLFFSDKIFLEKIERSRVLNFEKRLGISADAVLHISSSEFFQDKHSIKKYHLYPPLLSDELGLIIDMPKSYQYESRPIDLLCVANYEWPPNREGFDWFFQWVAPNLGSEVSIHLVGKGGERYASYPSVIPHGFVKDVSGFYDSSKVFISPVFKGAGIKVKNLEAMIYGVPIVSTSLGMDGLIGVEGFGGVAIGDSPETFLHKIKELLGDAKKASEQRDKAQLWIKSNLQDHQKWLSDIKRLLDEACIMNK